MPRDLRQRLVVVETGEEDAEGLLAARRGTFQPAQQIADRAALGGGIGRARIRDRDGARRIADLRIERRRGIAMNTCTTPQKGGFGGVSARCATHHTGSR